GPVHVVEDRPSEVAAPEPGPATYLLVRAFGSPASRVNVVRASRRRPRTRPSAIRAARSRADPGSSRWGSATSAAGPVPTSRLFAIPRDVNTRATYASCS